MGPPPAIGDHSGMKKHSQPSDPGRVLFEPALIRKYGGRGPRYTSYPTALQFEDAFTADTYRDNAVASNATARPLSVYVHVPFCHALCYYCGCNKIVTRNQARVERYLECLHREIELQAELFAEHRTVEQLHFGGGTPTYLDAAQLAALMQKLDDEFGLDRTEQHEFSIEVDPRTVDENRIRELAALGFNRLSLGIQDFDLDVQKAINRIQSVDEVATLMDAARDSGFRSISFDLIYGLPKQSVATFETTLDIVADLDPDRLAVYNYAHLPSRFKGQRMIDDGDIPSPDTKLEILRSSIERLCASGYEYIGMDHFARPGDDLVKARNAGTLQRNFQGYSTHRHTDLVGLGCSSIGSIGRVFAQNALTTMQYEEMLDNGTLPVAKGLVVDDDDYIRSEVIQELMCYDGLTFADFDEAFGIDFEDYFAAELARLDPMIEDGLVVRSPGRIAVTPRGRLLIRSAAMAFDRYLNEDTPIEKFSKAI